MNTLTTFPQSTIIPGIMPGNGNYAQAKPLSIYINKKTKYINIDDIVMLQGESNYTFIYLTNGKKILLSKTLKDFEAILTLHPFVRIHKSYLINLNYLQSFEVKHEYFVVMKTGQKVDISRRKKVAFQRKAAAYLSGRQHFDWVL